MVREQQDLNRASAGLWDGYARHRARVTALVRSHAPVPPGRLVLLGAGNCNDLELKRIAQVFSEIHLVDIDAIALGDAVGRQDAGTLPAIRLHGGVDVTRLGWEPIHELESANVVVSAALLTQLINSAVQCGRRPEELLLVRDAHLRTMADLLQVGGTGLLITDVVSSDTCPQLRETAPEKFPALLSALVQTGNFFTGCNPLAIARKLGGDANFRAAMVGLTAPWRWDIGDRSYLVCALTFRRRPGPKAHPSLGFSHQNLPSPGWRPTLREDPGKP
ncbi:MAG: hypothetical protein JWN52_6821 [Actinomycetia bacterium]|nr:hypothetical protein [Actinomycetes bacterium]